jgi:hypothetical protein
MRKRVLIEVLLEVAHVRSERVVGAPTDARGDEHEHSLLVA